MHDGNSGFSADTEVLTRRQGWITFDRLTYFDEVATRTVDGTFEWRHPQGIGSRKFSGEMWHLTARCVDLLVAPGQLLLVNQDQHPRKGSRPGWRSPDRVRGVSELAERVQRQGLVAMVGLPALSTWDAPDLQAFRLPETGRIHRRRPVLSGDHFAAFMGMYLAEGCVVRISHGPLPRRIVLISQQPFSKGYGAYRALLHQILGVYPVHNGGSFRFGWQALSDYLVQFGHAPDKFVPPEILDMPPRQLVIFWYYYMLGDGYTRSDDGRDGIVTTSREMADDLQEIVQKTGRSAAVCSHEPTREAVWADGHVTPPDHCRTVHVVKPRTSRVHRATNAALVSYRGSVHGLDIANGVVYVRRNDKPTWAATTL